jgi:hypothetical protein
MSGPLLFPDRRDPVATIVRGIEATAEVADTFVRAAIIRDLLDGEYMLAGCCTMWGRDYDDRHTDGGIHRCGSQSGHPGRHTCSVHGCRSWRDA